MDPKTKTIVDVSPLLRPVTRVDIRTFKATVLSEQQPDWKQVTHIGYVIGALVGAFILFMSVLRIVHLGNQGMVLSLVQVVAFLSVWLLVRWAFNYQYRRSVRFYYFAVSNHLSYRYLQKDPAQPGMLFSIGGSRESKDIIGTPATQPVPFELGEFHYVTGSGRSRQMHIWKYVRVTLSRPLPNMVLDSSANNAKLGLFKISNLPVSLNRDQVLHLEGDFDKHFTLYAPKEYERDALYVFTPDLMALFIDDTADFDAEIVDNYLYLYSQRVQFDNPATMQRIFAILEKLGEKVRNQTQNYTDSNVLVEAPAATETGISVAPQGRRLRRRFSYITVIILILYALITLAVQFHALGH